jgi:hypothetical protein
MQQQDLNYRELEQTLALAFGGEVPAASTATEEWTGAGTNNSYNHSFLTLYLSI